MARIVVGAQIDRLTLAERAAIANKFVLTRTAGNYVQASGAAEKFVFGPEIWLHRNTNTANGGSAAPIFDQYFSLPPVL